MSTDRSWVPPSEVDGYRLAEPLGSGGMGRVYRAHDVMLDRPVALKFVRAERSGEEAFDRLLNEARALARIQHPNVAQVYRVGQIDGRPYVASELIEGTPLSRLDLPLDWMTALRIGVDIAFGLAAVHRKGLLHRDIKPANVVLEQTGSCKLVDFGLAKRAAEVDDETRDTQELVPTPPFSDSLTATGNLVGTPRYMAPEIWCGESATAAADVYSAALVIHELASGERPYAGLEGAGLRRAAIEQPLRPLSELVPEVPEMLSRLIAGCLLVDPRERFADGGELADALAAIRSCYRGVEGDESAAAGLDLPRLLDSFGRIEPDLAEVSGRFYERLFAAAPDLRHLFPQELKDQRQKFAAALAVAVRSISTPAAMRRLLVELGHSHAAYGVTAEHLPPVAEALLAAIREADRASWSEDLARAWQAAIATMGEALARGLDQARLESEVSETSTLNTLGSPRTRYVNEAGVTLAYQVLGSGPTDLVFVPGNISHLELNWQLPGLARFLRQLADESRLIIIDKRGFGMSDRTETGLSHDERSLDLEVVLNAAGVERAFLFGVAYGGMVCAHFAATRPERVAGLVTYGVAAGTRREPAPWGFTLEEYESSLALIEQRWGEPIGLEEKATSQAHDPELREWWGRYLRQSVSKSGVVRILRASVRLLPEVMLCEVRVPTLILHRAEVVQPPFAAAEDLARQMPHSRLVRLSGSDHFPFVGDSLEIVREVQRFVRDPGPAGEGDHRLATAVRWRLPGGDRRLLERLQEAAHRRRPIAADERGAIFTSSLAAAQLCAEIMPALRDRSRSGAAAIDVGRFGGGGSVEGSAIGRAEALLEVAESGECLLSPEAASLLNGSALAIEEAGSPDRFRLLVPA